MKMNNNNNNIPIDDVKKLTEKIIKFIPNFFGEDDFQWGNGKEVTEHKTILNLAKRINKKINNSNNNSINKESLEKELEGFELVIRKIKLEGFHYCFHYFSDFKDDIKDKKFHKLRESYLNQTTPQTGLMSYINIRIDQLKIALNK